MLVKASALQLAADLGLIHRRVNQKS